ncbi:MAG: hypothetical protein QXR87_06700 [Candidatus Hadarchaeales archaeon]
MKKGLNVTASEVYFKHFRTLFPEFLQTSQQMKLKAGDPYLGYLHSIQFAKFSPVMEVDQSPLKEEER